MSNQRVRVIVDLEPCVGTSLVKQTWSTEQEVLCEASLRSKDREIERRQDRIRFLEALLRDSSAESARATFNLSFLQQQYERAMKEAKSEAALLASEKLSLQRRMEAQKWREEKLSRQIKSLEEANCYLRQNAGQKQTSVVSIPLSGDEEMMRKVARVDRYCQECGSNPKNTVNVPCGHMTSCNICVTNRRIEIGRSLRFIASAEKYCIACKAEVRKVFMAYVYY